MTDKNKTHELAAIVFTDIVGYTEAMEKDEEKAMSHASSDARYHCFICS